MSIKIGEHIKAVLSNDSNVARVVGDRIYPVVYARKENEIVKLPYIVYGRDNSTTQYACGGGNVNHTSASIVVVARTYQQLINIADDVVDCLDAHGRETYGTFEVRGCELSLGADDYDDIESAYTTTISATFTTQNINKD